MLINFSLLFKSYENNSMKKIEIEIIRLIDNNVNFHFLLIYDDITIDMIGLNIIFYCVNNFKYENKNNLYEIQCFFFNI